jgi:hypothetical protein
VTPRRRFCSDAADRAGIVVWSNAYLETRTSEDDMSDKVKNAPNATPRSRDELVNMIVDTLHRTIVHYGLWWQRVENDLGLDETIAVERDVWRKIFALYVGRLGKIIGFEVDENGIPAALKEKSPEELQKVLDGVSVNWLATDGIWFQAVERRFDLPRAQKSNNEAWERFSPFEAEAIRALHDISADDPLGELATALEQRLYANINEYTIERTDDKTLVLYMNKCRVQAARNRKGLEDYPCKSGGLIEYTTFAETIDARIKTECIGCPPDPHPDEWHCAWRFTLA